VKSVFVDSSGFFAHLAAATHPTNGQLSFPTGEGCTLASTPDEEKASTLLHAHENKAYSLCDAASFVVMERLGIREAIAFDRHFREYGCFIIL
jgi:predicted nucleic acid-binding protein